MTKKTLLIDGNSVGHYHNNSNRLTVGHAETQAIFGSLRGIRAALVGFPGYTPLVLWDGRADFRYELYPGYKGNREATDPKTAAKKESYRKQRPILQAALTMLGVRQMVNSKLEADDLAGYFVRSLPDNQIVLLTGDTDWLQLVRPGVVWFNPEERKVTSANFTEQTGYLSPRAYLEGKVLQGDRSDTITPVGGVGKKGAPEFLAQYGSVIRFLEMYDKGELPAKLPKAHLKLATENRHLFERNMTLMNLIDAPVPDREHTTITPGAYDEARFKNLCERLAFRSFLANFDTFAEPFKSRLT
jgi:DNA polymerase I